MLMLLGFLSTSMLPPRRSRDRVPAQCWLLEVDDVPDRSPELASAAPGSDHDRRSGRASARRWGYWLLFPIGMQRRTLKMPCGGASSRRHHPRTGRWPDDRSRGRSTGDDPLQPPRDQLDRDSEWMGSWEGGSADRHDTCPACSAVPSSCWAVLYRSF